MALVDPQTKSRIDTLTAPFGCEKESVVILFVEIECIARNRCCNSASGEFERMANEKHRKKHEERYIQ